MGLRANCYATLWSIEKKEKYTKVQMSTSKKDKATGTWETDWKGYANFVGQAHTEVAKFKEKDRVKIEEFEITNKYDKEKQVTYTYCSVFKISDPNGGATQSAPQASKSPDAAVEGAADEMPF